MENQRDNRVLGRRGARIVTETEAGAVSGGGRHTETKCSFSAKGVDGDVFTGDCIAN